METRDRLLDGESISSRHIVQPSRTHLELVDLVLAVAQILQVALKLALVLGALLATRNGLVHARGTADKDLDLLALLRLRQNSLQQLLGNVALAALPLLGRVVEDVEGAEALGVCVLELLPFTLKQDILLGKVTKHQGNLGLILRVLEDGAGSLPHGGDAGSSCNQGNVFMLVGRPLVFWDRALDVQTLPGLEVVHVLGHGSVGVLLDDEIDGALLIDIGDGSVGTNDGLLHLRALVLGDDGSYIDVSISTLPADDLNIQATGRPLSWSSSGSLKVSFLVLWLTISDFSRTSDRKPWSPPVKAFLTSPVDAGILLSSADGGAAPCCPEAESPPLRYR